MEHLITEGDKVEVLVKVGGYSGVEIGDTGTVIATEVVEGREYVIVKVHDRARTYTPKEVRRV